jgi:hypothetical protein
VTRGQALLVLAALGAAAIALLAVELGRGALDYGEAKVADPCTAQVAFSGSGLDATIQRIALDGLNGAACELHVTREDLVLSLDPNRPKRVHWDRKTIERAVRSGLIRSIDEAEERGSINGLTATVLRGIVERAPIDLLIRGGGALGGLLG